MSHPQHVPVQGMQQPSFQRQYSGSFVPNVNGNGYESGMSPNRSGSADSFGFAPYNLNGFQAQQQNGFQAQQQQQQQQQQSYTQLPYQQMAQSQYQNYPGAVPRSTNGFMPNGFPSYASPPSSVDPFRTVPNPSSSPLSFSAQMSPVMGSGGFAPPPGYGQNMPNNMYNYPQQQFFFSPPMQTVHSGGRGRRQR